MTSTRKLIAHRSTQGSGQYRKPRWVDVSVFHDSETADAFTLLIEAKSDIDGERTLRKKFTAQSIDALFSLDGVQQSAPIRMVRSQAEKWEQDNG